MRLFYALPLSTRKHCAWRPQTHSPMATSKKADQGAAELAGATKARKPRAAKKDKSTPPSQEAPAPPQPEVHEDIQAAYKFTPDEVAHMNSQLRQHLNDIDALEDQKKAAMQDFKLRITNKENEAKLLRNKLDSGEETRPVKALVEFDTPRSMKKFFHPHNREFIREEPMQPADWQLPMFKPTPDGTEAPAPKGDVDVPTKTPAAAAKPGKKTPDGDPAANAGSTPVGAVLTQSAAGTEAAKIELDLTVDYTHEQLLKAFKAVAKKAGWFETQISVIGQQLKLSNSVDGMVDILRSHTVRPAATPEKGPFE